MASKGFMGKGKKKKEKGTDWLEAGVQGGAILLALVKEAAEFAPIPYLKIAAGTTLKIVTTVQAVKDNKADYQRLAQDATEIIAVVWRSYQKAGDPTTWPQDKAEMVTDLVTTLHMILGHVEDQVKRSRTMRVIYSVADTVKIKEYRERLQAAISKFEGSEGFISPHYARRSLPAAEGPTGYLCSARQPRPINAACNPAPLRRGEGKGESERGGRGGCREKRIVEMEKVKAERDAALKEKLKMEELREDIDRQRKEQEKIAAEIKRWKEQQEEEAELARLKEAQRLREEKRLKEENERRAKLAKALEEEREEESKRVEAERPKASAEEKRRLEEAALQKKIESRRAKESDSLSPKSKSSKPPVIEISSDEDDEDDDESWEDDSESEYKSSEDEAIVQARLEEERKARKAAKKKKSNSAPSATSPEAAMHNAFAQMGLNPGGGGSSSGYPSPPASPYPGYPPYGGHSPYYGPPGMHPGMLSPPSLSTNNSGNVTNMSMSNIGNDNSIRYYGSKRSKKVTR
ncbi:hypothetical protein NLJ89_g3485 [Agrocybe chaxingu]|uniref:Uncharacterized protein n=1 Tax=Agrocybe chaxingu TaxID=84603 RepID=A0A9W8K2E5_9AGAR|nr:hypothetical protein NLJ89_g3485 [Agrocybe chaxingu]